MRIVRNITLLVLICSLLLCCCGINSQKGYPLPGTPVEIVNDETVTVVGSSIEDGKITVVLDVRFTQFKLNDFDRIIVSKSESGAKDIMCNIDETISLNQEDVFNVPYMGEVTLVFTDESICDEHKLWTYVMYMEFCTENGIDWGKGICIGTAK